MKRTRAEIDGFLDGIRVLQEKGYDMDVILRIVFVPDEEKELIARLKAMSSGHKEERGGKEG